jgi:hypothetical protein
MSNWVVYSSTASVTKIAHNASGIKAVGECPYCCWNGCRMKLQKIGICFTAWIYRDKLGASVGICNRLMSYSEGQIAAMQC